MVSRTQIAPIGEKEKRHIIEQICDGAFSYKEIKDKSVQPALRGWLSSRPAELLNKHAPERLSLPKRQDTESGVRRRQSAAHAMRIQELYGVNATPTIAMGRVPVLTHILARTIGQCRSPRI